MKKFLSGGFWMLGVLATVAREPALAIPVEEPISAPEVVKKPAPPGMVLSRSGQFRVSGGDGAMHGSAAAMADEARDQLLRLTDSKEDSWKHPILIVLHGKEGDPAPARTVAFDLNYNDQGFILKLDQHLAHGVDREEFMRHVTRALVLERSLRGLRPGPLAAPLKVPAWLIEGTREAVAWNEQRSDRRMYEAVFKRGGLYQVEQLLSLSDDGFDALDAPARDAFQVSAGALVMALLAQAQGKESFVKFLNDVASFDGEMPILLRKYFPGMNLSATSLAKWWQLQLANMAAAPLGESLSIEATEASLSEALHLHLPDGASGWSSKPMGAWREVIKLDDEARRRAVFPAEDDLTRLSYRCFPSHRQLIVEYLAILKDIRNKKEKDIDKRLGELAVSRLVMFDKRKHAADYLDWFEITRARETSGEFADYLKLKDRLSQQTHKRNDGVSDAMDRFDMIFARELPQAVKSTPIVPAGKSSDLGLPPE